MSGLRVRTIPMMPALGSEDGELVVDEDRAQLV